MGTTALLANSTIRLSPGWNSFWYWGVWAVCIIGAGIVGWAALRSPRFARWTTQDILIVAGLGVLLEIYDNIIGDALIGPDRGGSACVTPGHRHCGGRSAYSHLLLMKGPSLR